MSGNQQALLMNGGGAVTPPTQICVGDPFYDPPSGDPYWASVVLALHMDSNFNDSSAQNCSPTVVGNAAISASAPKFGAGCGAFDGNGDWVSYADTDLALGAGDFTIEFWVKVGTLSATQKGILGNSGGTPYWLVGKSTINRLFFTQASGGSSTVANSAVVAGAWYHVAIVRSSNTIRLYVNGIVQTDTGPFTDTTNYTLPTTIYVGNYGTTAGASFDGQIDDLRITKGIARYTGNFIIPAEAFPDFQATTAGFTQLSLHGESLLDTSAQPKTITNSGVTVSTTQSRFGGSSLYFSPGSVKRLAVTPAGPFQLLPGTPFTVEFYIYLNAAPGGPEVSDVIALGGPGAGPANAPVRGGWAVAIAPSRQLQFRAGDLSASTYNAVLTTSLVPTGIWLNVAVCFLGTNGQPLIFFDGVLQPTTVFGAVLWSVVTPNEPDSTQLFIGRYDQRGGTAPRVLDAYIDDLRVTTGVARYVASFPVPTAAFPDAAPADPFFADVSLLLHFDGANGGTTFVDSSSAGRTPSSVVSATTSTEQIKFGAASGRFVATNSAVNYASNAAFDFPGDFTMECWVYRASVAGTAQCMAVRRVFNSTGAGTWRWATSGFQTLASGAAFVVTYDIPLNVWTHVAISRSSGITSAFINGTLTSAATDTLNYSSAQTLTIGRDQDTGGAGTPFGGYIEEFRITKGVARYTVNFTPPSLTFCDSVNSQFAGSVGGTDVLDSQAVTSQQGTMRVLNPWVRLQGQQLLSAQGALNSVLPNRTFALTGLQIQAQTGVASPPEKTAALSGAQILVQAGNVSGAPYPNLVSSTISVLQILVPANSSLITVTIFSNGTFSVSGQLGLVLASGAWIGSGGFDIPSIASQYQVSRIVPIATTSFSPIVLPANLGATVEVATAPVAIFSAGSGGANISFIVVIVPTSNNPRFGEPGYNAQIEIRCNNTGFEE